ncbi:MAG: transposase [Methyloglobulus sp.]|nr:transposase [Methyloglobulus sp.]
MTNYRRIHTPGATWFFTVNLAERRNNTLLVENIASLRQSFRHVKQSRPFTINAVVVLPDHLHCLWTLPDGDVDYSIRWNLLKGHFSRTIDKGERISQSRKGKRERGIWQRRFWAHLITDQNDFNKHVDYIHWNPAKHGLVKQVTDWPYSSFHYFVKQGIYPLDWGVSDEIEFDAGEAQE